MNDHRFGAPSEYVHHGLNPRVELQLLLLCLMSILLVCLGPPSILLFAPMTQISCSPFLTSRTASHGYTSKQLAHATSCVHIHTYLHHIHITVHFLLHTYSTFFGRPAGSDSSRLTQKYCRLPIKYLCLHSPHEPTQLFF